VTALAANRVIPQLDPHIGGFRIERFVLAQSMGAAVITGVGPNTVTLTGTQNPGNLLGGPVSLFPIAITITTGGAVGTAVFSWALNGATQQSNVATVSTVVLGNTGLTANFAAATYVAGATYTFTPNYTRLFGGAIVCTNSSGQLVDGTASTSLTVAGVNRREVSNSPLFMPQLQPSLQAEVIVGGTFPFASGSGGDQLSAANIGGDVFLIDNQTVGATNGGSTRQRVGWLVDYLTYPDPRRDTPSWAAMFPAVVSLTANPSAP
jgi:hypothetical protein